MYGEKVYSLEEASAATGIPTNTLRTQLNRGHLSGVKVPKGQRVVWGLTDEVLQSLSKGQHLDIYERMVQMYLNGMRSGVHAGRALTPKHIDNMEKYLKRYWDILALKPTIAGINDTNFRLVMGSFKVDHQKRQDFYSTKDHIYKAVTGLTKVLIREGYKTKADLEAIRVYRPIPTFELIKGFVELPDIHNALAANRAWTGGRREYDVQAMDILISLYAFAGLRKMEAANLRLDQVHLDKNYLHVFGKWQKERIVPVFPILKERIENWLKYRNKASVYLVPQYEGIPLTESAINDKFSRFKEHCEEKKLDVRHIPPHDLRRSCATIAAMHGMPPPMIQLMLGHKDLKTTQGYLMLNERHMLDWVQNGTFNFGHPAPSKEIAEPVKEEIQSKSQPNVSEEEFMRLNDGF